MAEKTEPEDQGATFVSHLMELRDRLLRGLAAVLVVFILAAPFANDLYEYLAKPLMSALPEGNTMISTEPHGPFSCPSSSPSPSPWPSPCPICCTRSGRSWHRVSTPTRRSWCNPLMVSSSALFYAGIAFAYYIVFPLIFAFFTSTAPEGVAVMTDINAYLSFVLKLFFAFGIAFEVPVATVLMVKAGVTTPENLAGKRPYIIVGSFVAGMLLTPPDIFSQTMLALPVWVLFEAGLYFSRRMAKPDREDEEDMDPAQGSTAAPTTSPKARRAGAIRRPGDSDGGSGPPRSAGHATHLAGIDLL